MIEWQYLQRACGPDGIQALELDAMGPGIAEVANRLLQAAYGSRFQIEFRTTRIGGQGSKRKQIEDFQIVVHDSEDGEEQLFEMLSGGQAVWVKRAIYDAFGIIRDRNTGQRFLTAYQDEADGALDPEARLAYFKMLEAAHQESGRRHTIVITHSPEAQEFIAQKIEMEAFK
jgi:exonuclease SbcC